MGRGVWDPPGGIAQLVRIIDKHGRALEYDLMTRAGFTLEDVPSRVSFRALLSFVSHLGADSELVAELKPELAGWQGAQRVPMMLADVIDLLNNIGYMYASSHRGKGKPKPKQPRPYRRPVAKDDSQKVGSDPIPIKDFDEWWESGAERQDMDGGDE